jgi:hypothetical protein
MSDNLQTELAELRARLKRLEGAQPQPRKGWCSQAEAARYLGMADETLRARHARGEGPPRVKWGTRFWRYRYADLDRYAEQESAAA